MELRQQITRPLGVRPLYPRLASVIARGYSEQAQTRPEANSQLNYEKLLFDAGGIGGGGSGESGCKHLGGNDDGEGSTPNFTTGWLAFLAVSAIAKPAHAGWLGRKNKRGIKPSTEVDRLADLSWPILKNLGFSGILGAVAAIALKTVGQSLAVVVGVIFAIVQVGAYLGYVKVDWGRVHRDVIKCYDVNHDGKFDATDFKALLTSLLAVLSQGVPSVGGFCAGFTWALSL